MTSLISAPDRTRGDICPGAFKLHHATDGSIGRVRFPGGHVRPQQWADIARIATELGDGNIHVTTRGNMQFRGVKNGWGSIGKRHLQRDWTDGCIAVTDEEIDELYHSVKHNAEIEILP